MFNRIVTAAFFVLGLCVSGPAGFYEVPGTYPTIAAAVDAVPNGSFIQIAPGTYNESIVVLQKEVTLMGAGEPDQVIINGTTSDTIISNNANVTLINLTISGGGNNGASATQNGTLTAENCRLVNNGRFGGVANNGGRLVVRSCLFQDNYVQSTSFSQGGIRCDDPGTTLLVENCAFYGNQSKSTNQSVLVLNFTQAVVRDSFFYDDHVGINVGNSGTRCTATGNVFSNCNRALYVDRSAVLNAGDLSNSNPNDDGGNVLLSNNSRFFDNSGGTLRAQGNLVPSLDSAYLSARTNGSVTTDPLVKPVIDRVRTDAQWFEIFASCSLNSTQEFNISSWIVSDDPTSAISIGEGVYTMPENNLFLGMNRSVAFVDNFDLLTAGNFNVIPSGSVLIVNGSGISLEADSDELILRDPLGYPVDAVGWGADGDFLPSTFWTGPRVANDPDETMMREFGSTDTDTAEDWVSTSGLEGRVLYRPREALIAH